MESTGRHKPNKSSVLRRGLRVKSEEHVQIRCLMVGSDIKTGSQRPEPKWGTRPEIMEGSNSTLVKWTGDDLEENSQRAKGFLITPCPLWYGCMRWIIGPSSPQWHTASCFFHYGHLTSIRYGTQDWLQVVFNRWCWVQDSGRMYALFPLLCATMHGLRRVHASIIALSLRWRDLLFFNHSLVRWRWSQKTLLNSHWSCSWSGSVRGTGKSEK